jgi:ABC-type dipeptide/oligopeptide/nickel transport system permease component
VSEIKKKEFITAAIAKGMPHRVVVYKHILKNALIPVVTVAAVTLGRTVAGAVITERVFGIPGIGRLLVDAISSRDYAVVQADFMVIIMAVMLASLVADLLYAWLDPRIRLD